MPDLIRDARTAFAKQSVLRTLGIREGSCIFRGGVTLEPGRSPW